MPPAWKKSRLGKRPGTRDGSKVAPMPSRGPLLSGFQVIWTAFCCNCGLNGSVFSKALLKLWWQRLSNHCCVSAYATRIGGTGRKAITMRRGRALPCRQRRARSHITLCQRSANALQRKKETLSMTLSYILFFFSV